MAFSYPQDTEQLRKERQSYQDIFAKLNMDVWAPNGSDKTDHGMDFGLEYIEDGEYRGYRVLSQIKSTEHLVVKEDQCLFDFPVKTAAYAISCSQPFLLIVVDLVTGNAYFICLQDFFIENPDLIVKVKNNKTAVRIKLPMGRTISRTDEDMKEIAKRQYTYSPENGLRRVR